MPRKPKTENKKPISGQSPGLDTKRLRNQVFTFSENKLLDQITLEITEAWANDLANIRECRKSTEAAQSRIAEIHDLLRDKLNSINEVFGEESPYKAIKEILGNQYQIFEYINELRVTILDITTKLNWPSVVQVERVVKELHEYSLKAKENDELHANYVRLNNETLNKILDKLNSKKWWQFWK